VAGRDPVGDVGTVKCCDVRCVKFAETKELLSSFVAAKVREEVLRKH
jgi:hypothetical protein